MSTSKRSKSSKPSLIDPDFSGLWSCARLGHEKKWWSKIAGTLVIATFVYSWIGGFCVPFFILFLWYFKWYNAAVFLSLFILLPYMIPISPQPWIARIYMKYGAHYFSGGCTQSIEKPPPIRKERPPVLCTVHPHGILCIGYFLVCGIRFRAIEDIEHKQEESDKYAGKLSQLEHARHRLPRIGLAVGYLCRAPLFHLVMTKLTGCVASASNANMKSMMKRKISCGLLPGGFNEASVFKKGENIIYIKERKGFIKYCLQYGYEVFPFYIFGECETYNNLFHSSANNQWIMSVKQWLNRHKIPTVFPIGPYWYSPFFPFSNIGIHGIMSANTRYEHIEDPTREQIDEYHEWYMTEIKALFERHKWRFGYSEETHLKIV